MSVHDIRRRAATARRAVAARSGSFTELLLDCPAALQAVADGEIPPGRRMRLGFQDQMERDDDWTDALMVDQWDAERVWERLAEPDRQAWQARFGSGERFVLNRPMVAEVWKHEQRDGRTLSSNAHVLVPAGTEVEVETHGTKIGGQYVTFFRLPEGLVAGQDLNETSLDTGGWETVGLLEPAVGDRRVPAPGWVTPKQAR